ncbi:MAG TPA: C4-dicarboxylate ABC transporter substrate-binding protein [Planctomycetes bacterium]|nr:C4-dicarboxylate ABC transporter substrate-binding protein [Planctomycetota bacterium]
MKTATILGAGCLWVFATLVIPGAVCTAAPAKPIELTYSIFFPATHKNTLLAQEWAKEIEKRTDGRVKITVFPGGTLTKAEVCYDGVEKGISDIGMSVLGYTRGKFPLTEALDLPLGIRTGAAATALANAYYRKFAPKEFGGVAIMYLHAHGPGFLHTKKPVRTLEDVKGLKIRCTGLSAKIAAALGGTPVAMPMGETYDALSRGVVDGSMAPQESLEGWRWGEVVTSSTQCYGAAYTTTFFVAMNRDRWLSLPKDVQGIIEKVNEEWVRKTGEAWDAMDRSGRDFAAARGNGLVALSPEENARWAAAVQPILDEYAAKMQAKGLPGAEVLAFCRECLKTQK